MTILQLTAFLAVCEQMNYSRAAERVFMSRQALRQNIAALESELCGPLFENVRNHIALTPKGEALRAEAAPVVEAFLRMERNMYAQIRTETPLRLGISAALVPSYLPSLGEYLKDFHTAYPGVALAVEQRPNDAVAQAVAGGALDCGLVMDLGTARPGVERCALTAHKVGILHTREHPYWGKKRFSAADLDGQCVLVPGLGEEFAPLFTACRAAGAEPEFAVGESFYQVYYRVREEKLLGLDRYDPNLTSLREMEMADDALLEGLPGLYAAFIQPKGREQAPAGLLRDFLKRRLQTKL